MADDRQDDSQKTEEPTAKRLQEARDKGNVAKSQEVGHWFMILALTIVVGFLSPGLTGNVGGTLKTFLARSHDFSLESATLGPLIGETLSSIGLALLPAAGLAMSLAVLSVLIQVGFVLSPESIKPKLEKISPAKGLKRLFSLRSLSEFFKGMVKLLLVAGAVALVLWPQRSRITELVGLDMVHFLAILQTIAFRVLLAVLAVMTLVAILDTLFQRQQHMKQLRMSKQDVKDEFKQTEGDPMVKARLRQIRMERARQRMMAAVPEADVVIANPTHFAVALTYELGSVGAPKVVAKGADTLALKIREIAEQNDVTVVENPPLARALYGAVDLDQEIPPEHYKAVAEIIGYVFRLKGKMPGARA